MLFASWQRGVMKLSDYLIQNDLTPSAFATTIGLPASTITRIVNNERRTPRPETIEKIREGTNGMVSLRDWFPALQEEAA
jgi:transcriptional regulator with XRE-family HTH domain